MKANPEGAGLALTGLLYGKNSNPNLRKSCSNNKTQKYERAKARLRQRNLLPDQYEAEIRKITERLGV